MASTSSAASTEAEESVDESLLEGKQVDAAPLSYTEDAAEVYESDGAQVIKSSPESIAPALVVGTVDPARKRDAKPIISASIPSGTPSHKSGSGLRGAGVADKAPYSRSSRTPSKTTASKVNPLSPAPRTPARVSAPSVSAGLQQTSVPTPSSALRHPLRPRDVTPARTAPEPRPSLADFAISIESRKLQADIAYKAWVHAKAAQEKLAKDKADKERERLMTLIAAYEAGRPGNTGGATAYGMVPGSNSPSPPRPQPLGLQGSNFSGAAMDPRLSRFPVIGGMDTGPVGPVSVVQVQMGLVTLSDGRQALVPLGPPPGASSNMLQGWAPPSQPAPAVTITQSQYQAFAAPLVVAPLEASPPRYRMADTPGSTLVPASRKGPAATSRATSAGRAQSVGPPTRSTTPSRAPDQSQIRTPATTAARARDNAPPRASSVEARNSTSGSVAATETSRVSRSTQRTGGRSSVAPSRASPAPARGRGTSRASFSTPQGRARAASDGRSALLLAQEPDGDDVVLGTVTGTGPRSVVTSVTQRARSLGGTPGTGRPSSYATSVSTRRSGSVNAARPRPAWDPRFPSAHSLDGRGLGGEVPMPPSFVTGAEGAKRAYSPPKEGRVEAVVVKTSTSKRVAGSPKHSRVQASSPVPAQRSRSPQIPVMTKLGSEGGRNGSESTSERNLRVKPIPMEGTATNSRPSSSGPSNILPRFPDPSIYDSIAPSTITEELDVEEQEVDDEEEDGAQTFRGSMGVAINVTWADGRQEKVPVRMVSDYSTTTQAPRLAALHAMSIESGLVQHQLDSSVAPLEAGSESSAVYDTFIPSTIVESIQLESSVAVEHAELSGIAIEPQRESSTAVESTQQASGGSPQQDSSVAIESAQQASGVAVEAEQASGVAVETEQASGVAVEAEQASGVAVEAEQASGVAVEAEQASGVAVETEQASGVAVEAELASGVAVEAEQASGVVHARSLSHSNKHERESVSQLPRSTLQYPLPLKPVAPAAVPATDDDISELHRSQLHAFALVHAPAVLGTLDTAIEKFKATPNKLWDAMERRYPGTTSVFLREVDAAVSQRASLQSEHAEYTLRLTEFEAIASSVEVSTTYVPPPIVYVSADGSITTLRDNGEAPTGYVPVALTCGLAPVLPLTEAWRALHSLSPEEVGLLNVLRKPSQLLGVVLGALCVLLGQPTTWASAVSVATDPLLVRKLLLLSTCALSEHNEDAADAGGTAHYFAMSRQEEGCDCTMPDYDHDVDRLMEDVAIDQENLQLVPIQWQPRLSPKLVALVAKLLSKRPDARAEARAMRVVVPSHAGRPEALLPCTIVEALVEWEVALVVQHTGRDGK